MVISIVTNYQRVYPHVWILPRYLGKHPGGADILLSVVGRDATVEFETMRHSQLALNQLERNLGRERAVLDLTMKNGDLLNLFG